MAEELVTASPASGVLFEMPPEWLDNGEVSFTSPPHLRPRVFKTRAPADLHPNWETGKFRVFGMPVNYYVAYAENEWGVNVASSGLKSPYAMDAKAIETHLRNGISVIWMELPNFKDTRIQTKCLQAAVEHFFLNELSPVYRLFRPDVVRFASAHSTGGQCLLRLLNKPHLYDQMAQQYKLAFMDSPFLDTANASVQQILDAETRKGQLAAWFAESAFTRYAHLHAHRLPQDTYFGRLFLNLGTAFKERTIDATDIRDLKMVSEIASIFLRMSVKSVRDLLSGEPFLLEKDIARGTHETVYLEPTYGQILRLRERGRRICVLAQAPAGEQKIPVILAAGKRDPFSCPRTIRAMAEKIGAEYIEGNAAHNVLDQDETVLHTLMERCMAYRPVLIDMPEAGAAVIVTETRLLMPWIQRGINASLQRGAGALNAAASLFQRLRGRGVGDSEVGGEPESRPVDTGHALGLK